MDATHIFQIYYQSVTEELFTLPSALFWDIKSARRIHCNYFLQLEIPPKKGFMACNALPVIRKCHTHSILATDSHLQWIAASLSHDNLWCFFFFGQKRPFRRMGSDLRLPESLNNCCKKGCNIGVWSLVPQLVTNLMWAPQLNDCSDSHEFQIKSRTTYKQLVINWGLCKK